MVGWIEAAVLVARDRLQALDFRVSVIPHSTLFGASEPGLGEPLQPLKMARSSGRRLVVLPGATGDYFPISELRDVYLAVISGSGRGKAGVASCATAVRAEAARQGLTLPSRDSATAAHVAGRNFVSHRVSTTEEFTMFGVARAYFEQKKSIGDRDRPASPRRCGG
jgi:hypothetical protein